MKSILTFTLFCILISLCYANTNNIVEEKPQNGTAQVLIAGGRVIRAGGIFKRVFKVTDGQEKVTVTEELLRGVVELLDLLKQLRKTFELVKDEIEDIQGSDLKRVKGTSILYDGVSKLLVDVNTGKSFKSLNDVELLQAVSDEEGVFMLISRSP